MNTYDDLKKMLSHGEIVEGVVFGAWSYNHAPLLGKPWEQDEYEPTNDEGDPIVPFSRRGIVLKESEAKVYMEGWSFENYCASGECYKTYIWTNNNVYFIAEYDGFTSLVSVPRNPVEINPRWY